MRIPRLMIPVLLYLALPMVGSADCYVPNQICCVLEDGYGIEEVNQRWGTVTIGSDPAGRIYLLHIEGVADLEDFADEMTSDPAVTAAGANYHIQTPEGVRQMVIPAVGGTWDDYQDQSLTERIGLDEAHQMSRGAGVLVAVLDTGVDPDHIAFAGRLSPNGYDFIDDDAEPWETANGQDDDGDGLTDEGLGHGSMVAGIVALVAPEATILPIRVLNDEGLGTVYGVTRGIIHAMEQGADIMNMSFGIPLTIPTLWPELRKATDAGVIPVAGAGNEGHEEPPYYPAFDELTFMVTALDSNDVKADFADFNDEVLVSAPGVGVRSAYPGNEWGIGSGCSFATPFVAGEAALIVSLAGGIEDEGERSEVEERIKDAVDFIYDIPDNEAYDDMLGGGRINLPAALYDLWAAVPDEKLGTRLLTAWPNPAPGPICFRLTLAEESARSGFQLTVVDPTGRVVLATPISGAAPLLWNGRDRAGRLVPAGHYWARTGGVAESPAIPLTILR
jgi:subtilisin family serine protease